MTYREFNKRVFELYLSRSSSSFAIFSFDTFELGAIMPVTEIKRLEILRNDWSYLLRETDNIPQYFGLLAIQCCAASMMETSDDVTLNAYQLRLVRLLGLKDEAELQQLFKQESFGRPVQEVLWSKAKQYLKERLNQDLAIPPATTNAGRYVQYPKSQALFNTEELKYFTLFFTQTFQVKENLTYSFFEHKFRSSLKNMELTPRMRELLNDPRKEILCIKQLYDYYNRWNGELYDLKKKKEGLVAGNILLVKESSRLILILKADLFQFYLTPKNTSIPFAECLGIKDYHYFYKTIQVFSEIPGYRNEYEHSRFIYKETPCCLLITKSLSNHICAYLTRSPDALLLAESNGIALYTYLPSDNTLNSPLQSYFQSVQPVLLSGGMRLKQKDYLVGFGPFISCNNAYVVLFQNAQYNYHSQHAVPGKYLIRTQDFRDQHFNIIEPEPAEKCILPNGIGWNLSSLVIGLMPDVEGCLIENVQATKVSPVRSWISINLKNTRTGNFNQNNPLLMAINNAKS